MKYLVLCMLAVCSSLSAAETTYYYNRNYQPRGYSTTTKTETRFYNRNYRQVGRATGSKINTSKYTPSRYRK